MSITIRRAGKEDCQRLLDLVKELAEYERAPHEVTVTLQHFEDSGFGDHPVWWGFVAVSSDESFTLNENEIVGFALYYVQGFAEQKSGIEV